ncbi:MAG: hypothetical protein HYV02_01300 [Deltaproteobacteria bacterium]|nr:hypothetical protein [Deltaproteobacteria bacterium]
MLLFAIMIKHCSAAATERMALDTMMANVSTELERFRDALLPRLRAAATERYGSSDTHVGEATAFLIRSAARTITETQSPLGNVTAHRIERWLDDYEGADSAAQEARRTTTAAKKAEASTTTNASAPMSLPITGIIKEADLVDVTRPISAREPTRLTMAFAERFFGLRHGSTGGSQAAHVTQLAALHDEHAPDRREMVQWNTAIAQIRFAVDVRFGITTDGEKTYLHLSSEETTQRQQMLSAAMTWFVEALREKKSAVDLARRTVSTRQWIVPTPQAIEDVVARLAQ